MGPGGMWPFQIVFLFDRTLQPTQTWENTLADIKPKLIIAGASAYPRTLDFPKFREICDAVGAYLMVDMAHIAGLIVAGLHPSPVPYADFVTEFERILAE